MEKNIEIALGALEVLKDLQTKEGNLFDPIDQEATPPSHYALTFYALGAYKAFLITGEEEWKESSQRALSFFFGQRGKEDHSVDRGHKEFNDLALLWLYHLMEKEPVLEGVVPYVEKEIPDEAVLDQNLPNNWLAVRAVSCALKSQFFPEKSYKEGLWLFEKYLTHVQLKDGLFYDLPSVSHQKEGETPLVYHSKICAMFAMGYSIYRSPVILRALTKGLRTLSHLTASDGEAFPFGRTNNGLFGYANAYFAFFKTASFLPASHEDRRHFIFQGRRFLQWLEKYREKEGLFALTPNPFQGEKMGWDVYMHSTVYNAYAAAFLLLAEVIPEEGEERRRAPYFYAEKAGLLAMEGKDSFSLVSTKGQKSELFPLYGDERTKGMTLYKYWDRGKDWVCPPEVWEEKGFEELICHGSSQKSFKGSKTFGHIRLWQGEGVTLLCGKGVWEEEIPARAVGKKDSSSFRSTMARSLEKSLPRKSLPLFYRVLRHVKKLKLRNKPLEKSGYEKGIIFLPAFHQMIYCFSLHLPQEVDSLSWAATPPLGEDVSESVRWKSFSSLKKGVTRKERVRHLKTSKGKARQNYQDLELTHPSSSLLLLSIVDYSEKEGLDAWEVSCQRSPLSCTLKRENLTFSLSFDPFHVESSLPLTSFKGSDS